MEAAEMEKMIGIHQLADEVRASILPKVPDPKRMMRFYSPMQFNQLSNGDREFIIEPSKSTCFDATTFHHAIMFGVKQLKINYGREVQFHKLVHKGNVLTSDAPVEIFSQWIAFSKARGDVLVGGLGLGMAPTMMLEMPRVKSVTVVEKEPKIIKLVGPQTDPRIKIVEADLYDYLKTPEARRFDFAYHDIWYGTGESTWVEHIVPLYRLTRQAGIKHMGAWGEAEMWWQLASALYTRTCVEEKYSSWTPYEVFIKGVKKVLGGEPPYGPERKDEIAKLIKLYLFKIGAPAWEKTFDWPEAQPEAIEKAS